MKNVRKFIFLYVLVNFAPKAWPKIGINETSKGSSINNVILTWGGGSGPAGYHIINGQR